MTSYNILPPFQYGFRPDEFTQEFLLKLQTDANSLNVGKYMLKAFVNIEQAFDKVCHEELLQKPLAAESRFIVRVIRSFLTHRCAVTTNNHPRYTHPALVSSNTPY